MWMHAPFRLVQKSTTLDDLKRPIRTLLQKKMHLSEFTTNIWMKVDPYRQQKCRPITVVSEGIRYMRIVSEVPWGGASNDSQVVDNSNFQRFRWLSFSKTLEMRRALLYNDTQSVVSFSVITKCMTLNDLEWLFRVKFCFLSGQLDGPLSHWQPAVFANKLIDWLISSRFGWLRPCDFRKIIARKLIEIDTYCQRRKSSAGTLVSGNIRFVRTFARVLYRKKT